MSTELSLPNMVIQHRGFFDSAELTRSIQGWYQEKKYSIDFPVYKQETRDTGVAYDQEWKGKKKVTEYIQFVVDVTVKVINMNNIEIIKDGVHLNPLGLLGK